MTLHSKAVNGYKASLIGKMGVGDVGKYGFGLGDSVSVAFPQTGNAPAQGMGPELQPGVVDDSGAFAFLSPPASDGSSGSSTPAGTPSSSTSLWWLAGAVAAIFLVTRMR